MNFACFLVQVLYPALLPVQTLFVLTCKSFKPVYYELFTIYLYSSEYLPVAFEPLLTCLILPERSYLPPTMSVFTCHIINPIICLHYHVCLMVVHLSHLFFHMNDSNYVSGSYWYIRKESYHALWCERRTNKRTEIREVVERKNEMKGRKIVGLSGGFSFGIQIFLSWVT